MGKHGTGNVREHPGGGYRLRMQVNGEKIDRVFPDSTEEEVQEWAEARAAELRDRRRKGLPGRIRFSDLLKEFEDEHLEDLAPNTARTYKISVAAFRRYFVKILRDPWVDEIRKRDINGFLHWRRDHRPDGTKVEATTSARTRSKDRAVLSAVFTHAMDEEYVDANPVRAAKKPKGDSREPIILSSDQYESLSKACKDRPMLETFVLLLGESGVRCESEGLWLRWTDIDMEGGYLTVETTRKGVRSKSGKIRHVPLTARLRQALQDHAATYRMRLYNGERSPWVFHHLTDRRRATAGKRIGSLRRAFEAAVKRADLPAGLVQHDLRHRRVTTWLEAGKSVHLVQRAMGHANIKTTLGYYRFVKEHLRPLVEQPATTDDLKALVANGS